MPFTLRKGSIFPNLSEEDKLGYVPEAMAKTWEVSRLINERKGGWRESRGEVGRECVLRHSYASVLIGHGGACEQGAGQGHWNL